MVAFYASPMIGLRHPDSIYDSAEWDCWRLTFEGGEDYLRQYLKKWTERETDFDFFVRMSCTPIPAFAKAAILDIRNNIFQRLGDISRLGGSLAYQKAVSGEDGGVDRKGSSMNSFMGIDVLTELLLMGRVGVYVDAPSETPFTLADQVNSPYMYLYRVEDIVSWVPEDCSKPGQFKSIVLRDYEYTYDETFGIKLPQGREERFRVVWKDEFDRKVYYKILNKDKIVIRSPESLPDGSVRLDIEIVPFVMLDIQGSLMKDIASYQKALLNLASSDVMWALRSNVPFLTIQADMQTLGSHLKKPGIVNEDGTIPAQNTQELIGAGRGRYYPKDLERPDFIAPPTDPLKVSIQLQEKYEDDIRKLVNLAVANKIGSRTESAEAKKLSSQGLEAGLSYIGLVLQQAEQLIAEIWAHYENRKNPDIAKISYPKRYILKDDKERIEEADALLKLVDKVNNTKLRKHLYSQVAQVLLSGRVEAEEIASIVEEMHRAKYTTSDIDQILRDHEAGMVSTATASEARGYASGEWEQAKKDRAEFVKLTLEAQTPMNRTEGGGATNPASRGAPELDTNPDSGSDEKVGKEKRGEQQA